MGDVADRAQASHHLRLGHEFIDDRSCSIDVAALRNDVRAAGNDGNEELQVLGHGGLRERRLRVAQRTCNIVTAEPDQRSRRVDARSQVMRSSSFDLGEKFVGRVPRIVPAPKRIQEFHANSSPKTTVSRLTEACCVLGCFLPFRACSCQLPELPQCRRQVVQRPAYLVGRFDLDRDRDGSFDVVESPVVADVHAGNADVVERMRTKRIEAKLFGHAQRLSPDADRLGVITFEHQQAGEVACDARSCRRNVATLYQFACSTEVRERLVMFAAHPVHLPNEAFRLGCALLIAVSQE